MIDDFLVGFQRQPRATTEGKQRVGRDACYRLSNDYQRGSSRSDPAVPIQQVDPDVRVS